MPSGEHLIERNSRGLTYFVFPGLGGQPGLLHAVASRHGGVSRPPFDTLNLSLSVGDDEVAVRENRRRLAAALDLDDRAIATARQVHGVDVWHVLDPAEAPPKADVLLTNVPGIALSQRFADCVPILLWDPRHRAVASAHAGWRGTASGLAAAAVRAMRERFSSEPSTLYAAIGPSIGPCCYEVGPEVAGAFAAQPDCARAATSDRAMLNLWELNRRALQAAGVADEHIEVARVCTRCRGDLFFSHRAMGYPAGRFGTVIGVAR